jgi:hypothetical protein
MGYAKILVLAIFVYLALMALFLVYKYLNISVLIEGVQSLHTISKDGKPEDRLKVSSTAIDSPTSVRYFYGLWVFVDSNTPPDRYNVIFNKDIEFILSLKGRTLYLHSAFDTDTAKNGSVNANGVYTQVSGCTDSSFNITDNFPFQKWAHIIICVDGDTVDAYLDGKLVNSKKMKMKIPAVKDIHIGNIYTEGKITRFRRDTKVITPQGAWKEYKRGNGVTGLTGRFMPYGVDLAFIRNENKQTKLKLF